MTQKDPSGTLHSGFAYDRLNQLTFESAFNNQFLYDSLGNCRAKNNHEHIINALNQLTAIAETTYSYDLNGNLKKESFPPINYVYDALNRLIRIEQESGTTILLYDAFSRCIELRDSSETKKLLYQGQQEIGSLKNGQLNEFRLIHPEQDHTLAIELEGKAYFPIQDAHGNVVALQSEDNTLAQWIRYSAFGEQKVAGKLKQTNPWRYANRRELSGLILFSHRLYNPRLMRWQTTDPICFEDGLNLYHYVHNNPFAYRDPDGRFAFVVPFLIGVFGTGGVAISAPTIGALAGITAGSLLGWGVYEMCKKADTTYNQVEARDDGKEKRKEKFKFPENPDDFMPELPRDEKGRIQPADNVRIRPEKHPFEPGETYNPRHHGQHYHIETQRNPGAGWGKKNTEKLKPAGYTQGAGTGFLPGETYPGI